MSKRRVSEMINRRHLREVKVDGESAQDVGSTGCGPYLINAAGSKY